MTIFRDYDIRGIYPDELNEKIALDLGKAIGSSDSSSVVYLGYDNRKGSLAMWKSVAQGLAETGKQTINVGLVPTMIPAFASFREHTDGVILTASHNPPAYGGVLLYRNGITVKPEAFKTIYESRTFKAGKGKEIERSYDEEYITYITKDLQEIGLKVATDTMGGATTGIVPAIFKKVGISALMLHDRMDPNFFGKTPEPSKENARELAQFTIQSRADLGVQFDGDGNRVVFIDEKGRFVEPMKAAMLFIKYLGFKKVTATVACSQKLQDFASVTYTKVGRPYLEEALSNGYDFGIELSMHVYFGSYYPFPDGILGALLMSKIISETGKRLSDLEQEVPEVYMEEFSINTKSGDEADRILGEIERQGERYGHIDTTDGVKIIDGANFILFRKSNTEPLIRCYYEGENERALIRQRKLAKYLLEKAIGRL